MKKTITLLLCAMLLLGLFAACTPNELPPEEHTHHYVNGVCTQCNQPDPDYTPPQPSKPTLADAEKHLIPNADGSYGGTLNKGKYGEGAPLNGQYDHKDGGYWLINDFYNMKSTETRTMLTKFQPYQQTMADSDGIACALMTLNYLGEDVYATYTEENLVKTYEAINKTTVYGKGVTPIGLKNLFTNLGYSSEINTYSEVGSTRVEVIGYFSDWLVAQMTAGKIIMAPFQDGMKFGWHVIIGVDTMGTDYCYDDVLILADPYDNLDHYQDGYYLSGLGRFYRWWLNVADSGVTTNQFECIAVTPKTPITYERVANDQPTQQVPELHLLLNPDGSYGGTLDAEKYGVINVKNGSSNQLGAYYHPFIDYYNMESEGSRLILPHYRAFEQRMASSCGICSTLSVLAYYGEDVTVYDEEWLTNKYCEVNGKTTIYNVGCGSSGLKKLVAALGYSSDARSFTRDKVEAGTAQRVFADYAAFATWVKNNLKKGTPMPISWRPHGGHWEVIIGYDDMDTDYIYDDVLVLADSSDVWDHYQDGYDTFPATLFFRQWYNGSFTYNQQYNVFDRRA